MQVTDITGYVPEQKLIYCNLEDMPIEKQRFKFFANSVYGWVESTRAETDTHVYWATNTCTPKWNKKTGVYLKKSASSGCTYDKAKKTFKFWYGKQVNHDSGVIPADMCNYFKVEWFNNIPAGLKLSTTNSNMKKVFLGKITNPRDLIKAIVKANPTLRGMNISTELLWDYCNLNSGCTIQSLCDALSVAKDPNHAIEHVYASGTLSWQTGDLIKQAQMLDRKIDFKWSVKRMAEVHNEWTREIMDIEQENVEKVEYEYTNELPHNGCLELITDSKELYVEGRMMDHCVYTNYASSVANRTYFVFKYTDRNVRATLAVSKRYGGENFIVDQFYGKRNTLVEQYHHDFVNEWVARPEVQQWFKENAVKQSEPELVPINF